MSTDPVLVHDNWNGYFTDRHGVGMTISFDETLIQEESPEELDLCARILIPISETQPNSAWPTEAENERLYSMEDELVDHLQANKVPCRLVGRMTYDGLREIVFQVGDQDGFRPIVGRWMQRHGDYEIDVSEHEGWSFFDDFIHPTKADRRHMADNRVIDNLIENGSDPHLPHELEFCFRGEPSALEKIAESLSENGYSLLKDQDLKVGQVVLSKSMTLDRGAIRKESDEIEALAQKLGGELEGWGASVVRPEDH